MFLAHGNKLFNLKQFSSIELDQDHKQIMLFCPNAECDREISFDNEQDYLKAAAYLFDCVRSDQKNIDLNKENPLV